MKKFRRSTKSSSDRTDSLGRPPFVAPKDPTAIVPPKKVIKALYSYQVPNPADNPDYLSFNEGDFLHVVGRESDTDWYEACNPVVGRRGLVPVNHFEEVGKQARSSQASSQQALHSRQQSSVGHDSGYHERPHDQPAPAPLGDFAAPDGAQPRMSKLARGNGAMVYGIVQYDFKAERSDELDAKAGEAIIVIAQSNQEWFVAKPIQRLGGPGLIPVSFIEIRDMSTGQAVQDPHEAVRRAGVPKVEEWKKMAAEYKNSSIPLGRLDMAAQSSTGNSLAQGMDRMSLHGAGQARQSNPQDARYPSDPRAPSMSQQRNTAGSGLYPQPLQSQQRHSQMLMPVRAKVPRYRHEREEFWFLVEVVMEDQRGWELQRNYKDFYGLQLSLKEQFPQEAGAVPGCARTLPLMPGPVPWVSEHITAERRVHLDKYLKDLLNISPGITSSLPVRQFFAPREGDVEAQLDSFDEDDAVRLSQGSSQHSGPIDSRQSSTGNVSATTGYTSPQRQLNANYHPQSPYGQKPPPQHHRNPSDLRVPNGSGNSLVQPPPIMRNNSAMTSTSNVSSTSGAPVKVKVWFGDSNIVVLRLPPAFGYSDLVQKIRERWSLEPGVDRASLQDTDFRIEWKDESNNTFNTLDSERELQTARERTEKLTLRVEPPGL